MREIIKQSINNAIALTYGNVFMPDFSVERPEQSEHGDYSTNATLLLAKTLKKNPMEIARVIAAQLEIWNSKLGIKIEIAEPGFINFFILSEKLTENLRNILKQKGKIISDPKNKKEIVIIEYSAPNIAKPMGVHHLRSTAPCTIAQRITWVFQQRPSALPMESAPLHQTAFALRYVAPLCLPFQLRW